MIPKPDFHNEILTIQTPDEFRNQAIKVFHYQYVNNVIYRQYCNLINVDPQSVKTLRDIPFLPISVFKTHNVFTGEFEYDIEFTSSGTTGMTTSSHYVKDVKVYEASFLKAFEQFYGSPDQYIIIGLLPNYLERGGSSLVYMVNQLIERSGHEDSGFYLNNLDELAKFLKGYSGSKPIFLIGVSYALLDLAHGYEVDLSKHIVMETGGMKGKRREMTKDELHQVLKDGLKTTTIHSEYGMTELLSQAYAKADGLFSCPPWMKVLIRETSDPFNYVDGKSGGINVIDLANIHSCAFIATQDLGRYVGESFKVLGRFDNADLRGCNLLVQ